MAYTRTWDTSYEASPQNADQAKNYALEVRNFKVDVRERMDTEHSWGSSGTGRHKFPLLDQASRDAVSDPVWSDGAINIRNGDSFLVPFAEARISSAWKPVLGYNVGTSSQRMAIPTTKIPTGFVFFDTTDGLGYYWNGSAWAPIVLSGSGISGRSPYTNILINGSFEVWQRGTTAITLADGVKTYYPDRMYAKFSGASTGTIERVSTGLPTGAVSRYGAKLTGNTSITTVSIGQKIESCWLQYYSGIITVTARIKYTDGASGTITPTLRLATPSSVDNFAVVTVRQSIAHSTAINNGQLVWGNIDVSGFTDLANGLEVFIEFPSGSLNVATKNVVITDFQVERGIAKSDFEFRPLSVDLPLCKRYYEKTFPYSTAPAQNAGRDGALLALSTGRNAGFRDLLALWMFEVEKRIAVSISNLTFYNPLNTNAQWRNLTTPGDSGSGGNLAGTGGSKVLGITNTSGISGSTDEIHAIHVVCDAEL